MTRTLLRLIHLFLLLFAGFFISGALTPSVSEESIGTSDGLNEKSLVSSSPSSSYSPPPSRLPVPDLSTGSLPARSLLSSDERKYDKFLLAGSDGTFYLVDSQSNILHWKLVTGSPLLHSKQADSEVGYFIDFGKNGRLYEYNKQFGHRELNSTLEELVQRAPVIVDSTFTFGSKETTLLFINETNGEVFSRHHMPATQTKVEPLVEEKLVASQPVAGDGYIMLVRTDYSLRSVALPIDPTQISTDPDEPLWQLSRSHINAVYMKSGLPSNMAGKHVSPSPYQMDIPVITVHLPPMISKVKVTEDLMLPSTSQSYDTDNQNQDTLMLPAAPTLTQSIAETSQSPLIIDKIWEQSNDCQNNISEDALEYSDADEINSRKMSHELRNFQSEYDEGGLNFPSMLRNLPTDSNTHLAKKDYAAIQTFNEIPAKTPFGFIWFLIPFMLIILACWHMKFKDTSKDDDKFSDLKGRQSISPKKRKARKVVKTNAIVSNNEKVFSSDKEDVDGNGRAHPQSYGLHSFQNFVSSLDASDGRWVGKLFMSNLEIGRGSNGTVVFEGVYDGRPVAVKRLLRAHNDIASKEIQNLIASDQHPNILRWYGVEHDLDFVYISLERCSCSLSDLIQLYSDASADLPVSENRGSITMNEQKFPLICEKGIKKDLELWRENGFPSPHLLKLMRDVVAGLAHLHELGIIHRDMKPHNVLISTDRYLNAKLSDMGISKRLLEDMSSLTQHTTGSGSSGWQAPEQLLHGRQTRSVDLFSLGCILFFCITKGRHPFGNHFERDANIVNNRIDLFLVDHIPEAVDLLSQLLDPNPNMRLSAVEVLHHPFFWNSEMRLTFLRDTSDRVELEDRENGSDLLKALESVAPVAFGGRWGEKLDIAFLTDMGRYRKYNFDCLRDLLRVIRNKLNHYRELSEELKEILGSVPEGFDRYFSSRFPNLLIEVYKVMRRYCSNEDSFSKYFANSLV